MRQKSWNFKSGTEIDIYTSCESCVCVCWCSETFQASKQNIAAFSWASAAETISIVWKFWCHSCSRNWNIYIYIYIMRMCVYIYIYYIHQIQRFCAAVPHACVWDSSPRGHVGETHALEPDPDWAEIGPARSPKQILQVEWARQTVDHSKEGSDKR